VGQIPERQMLVELRKENAMATVVMRCACTANKAGNEDGAKAQDKTFGKGLRLHNSMAGDKFRCTVCGNERGK
jgi:hypothetical protein